MDTWPENQNKLAFREAEVRAAVHGVQRGLARGGGVEPVKYPWYPPLF